MPTGTFFYYQQIGLEASVLKQGTALAYIILKLTLFVWKG